jgi:hypothetical protein
MSFTMIDGGGKLTEENCHRPSFLHHTLESVFIDVLNFVIFQMTQQPVEDFVFVHQVALVAVWLLLLEEDNGGELWGGGDCRWSLEQRV